MKILFISDFTLKQRQGGAQVSNDLILKKGRELGHEIKEHDHTSSIVDFLSSYDLVINSNLEAITQTSPEKLNYIKKLPNSVRLEHDSCLYLNAQHRQELFENSKINFFLTQYHHKFFTEMYGDYFENVEIVYDPIDTNIFSKSEDEKIYDVVYCGYLHHLLADGYTRIKGNEQNASFRQRDWLAKGKERTTNPDEYILAHDLDKKAPRNISVKRLKWFSVGKKVYKINRLEVNEDITIVMFDKVKFTALKTLMTKGELDE